MRTIPRAPAQLRLAIDRRWDGAPAAPGLHGAVSLAVVGDALEMRAELCQPGQPRVPAAAPGLRVEGLWHYDVVECFLAGAGGRYLEIELGAGGHFLVLAFRAPRVRSDAHERLLPRIRHGALLGGWWAALRVPLAVVPAGVRAGNAFAIACGEHLAHSAMPGAAPDFHRPPLWPALRIGA